MSTLADATLIQSAMENHQAEWLSEGQHVRAAVTAIWRLEGLQTCLFFSKKKENAANLIFLCSYFDQTKKRKHLELVS